MPFFSDYGYYHGSAPFSSQYYSQLLPYPGSSSSSRPITRVQPRNYNSMLVEQTLRAIRRGGPGAASARQYSRPVHINASEIDVTSPRRPRRRPSVTETATVDDSAAAGSIHRGRTVVRLHTKTKRTEKPLPPPVQNEPQVVMAVVPAPPEPAQLQACMSAMPEEGLAKKGTIKRHTSAGIKVPVNDDRRPSVTDEILREQEALFDTMIMEEMDAMDQKGRRKSYPVDTDGNKKQQKTRDARKKSAAGAMVFCCSEPVESPSKQKTNWKLNYDVIIEESGIEPVSYTFKLNKSKKDSSGIGVGSDNGKLDANHNVVRKPHDDSNKNNNNKKHEKSINKNQINNNNNSDDVRMSEKKTKVVKKKIIVKKKVIKKKESEKQQQQQPPQQDNKKSRQAKKTLSPQVSKKKGSNTATATAAVITPFVRASFGKTFISPSQVSKTKSKFEKPKAKPETPAPLPPEPPSTPETLSSKNESPASSSEDESSSDEETSSLCSSSSSTSSGSTYYDSDDYGDNKRIACSISSFDSGLPSSPVPATDPIGRKTTTTITITITTTYYYTNTLIY